MNPADAIIESDVPLPGARHKAWLSKAGQMKIDDSVLVDNEADARALAKALSELGTGSRVRTETSDAGEGYRVWATEKRVVRKKAKPKTKRSNTTKKEAK